MSELSKEQFYEWLSKHEVKILEKQSELDIKLQSFEREVTDISRRVFDDEHLNREFETFFYKVILPKVGSIIDREKNNHEKLLDNIHDKIEDLDGNTVKKSNVSKYVGAILGVVFAGGLGSIWNSLYDMQTKLDSVPLLKTQVSEMLVNNRDVEKQLFVMEGNVDSMKESMVVVEDKIMKVSSRLNTAEKSIETNTYSISDAYSKLSKILPKNPQ
jgi:tetrahydromethanopterin S-methyltransferase subunit G